MRRALATIAVAPGAVSGAWLLTLLVGAAAVARRPTADAPPDGMVVVVPAHDEEATLPDALAALSRADGSELVETLVVADACSDRTAELARAAGATVLERRDPEVRGKGAAVAHALAHLRARSVRPRTILVLDADCTIGPNALGAAQGALRESDAAQLAYVVANPEASRHAALRFAGFAVVNGMRPAGRTALGLSSGLLGTGMAFRADLVLDRVPMTGTALAEDLEYALELLAHGVRPRFVRHAAVRSPMPVDASAGGVQAERWERGRIEARRRWLGPLLGVAARRREPRVALEAAELLSPPLSVLTALPIVGGAVALLLRRPAPVAVAVAATGAHAVAVLGAQVLAGAPRSVYTAILGAGGHALRRAALVTRLTRSDEAPQAWERTART